MIDYDTALKLLKKHLKDDTNTIEHCKLVSDFAFKIATKIKSKHPGLNIDPNKLRIAGLLHDIAKNTDTFHYFEGEKILKNKGLEDIGRIISKHMKAHEVAGYKNIEWDFIPRTIEEKILAYADLNFYKQNKVTPEQRIEQKIESARKKEKLHKIELISKARPRLLALAKEIEEYL